MAPCPAAVPALKTHCKLSLFCCCCRNSRALRLFSLRFRFLDMLSLMALIRCSRSRSNCSHTSNGGTRATYLVARSWMNYPASLTTFLNSPK
jgi:hypothetical protein